MKNVSVVLIIVAWLSIAGVQLVTAQTNVPPMISFGGDERVRQEAFDNIPVKADPPGVTRGGANNYLRIRTRLWTQLDLSPDISFKVRVADEFRLWTSPSPRSTVQRTNYDYPDEIVFDNLYLDLRNLLDNKLDVRIGRQDLVYGNGRVILEGTPKDGSRTIYFNAVKATWKGVADTTIDFLGIYNPSIDPWAIHDSDRDLTGMTSANNDMDESGGGFYLMNKSMKFMPVEVYGIYKRESEWDKAVQKDSKGNYPAPAYAWQTLDAARGVFRNEALDLYTGGFRLIPKFNDSLSGNLELAGQAGERGDVNVSGYMLDAYLTYQLPFARAISPALIPQFYYLSGDDPSTRSDEGWNPLWSRQPQMSELYIYAWDYDGACRWSNLSAPGLGISITPASWLKNSVIVSHLDAPEADGPGGGHERGWYFQIKNEFVLGEHMFTSKDKLTAHLWLELLKPGDYYKVDNTAYFARWQMMYEF